MRFLLSTPCGFNSGYGFTKFTHDFLFCPCAQSSSPYSNRGWVLVQSAQAYLSIFALVVSVALNCVGEKPVGFRTFVHVVLSSDNSQTKGENPKGPHPLPHSSLLQFKAECNLFRLMLAGTRISHFDLFRKAIFSYSLDFLQTKPLKRFYISNITMTFVIDISLNYR